MARRAISPSQSAGVDPGPAENPLQTRIPDAQRDSGVSTSLSVIVPVYNEQYLVATSLGRLLPLADSALLHRIQVIVVDDCSRDATGHVLNTFRESVRNSPEKIEWVFLRHERNLGKGGAICTALQHATCELTVIHDADLEYHPHDLLRLIRVFAAEDADAVFGSRFLAGEFKRVLFFRHSLGNHLLTFLCDVVCDLNLTDMETCYKMVRTDLLKSIPLESRDFRIEPELTIKLAKRGARIFEVPISYSGRTYQEGKKINWKDGFRALWSIAKFAVSDRTYAQDEYGSNLLPRLSRAPKYTRWLADTIRPYIGEKVLEIGAGVGNLTLNLVPRSLYVACDANPLFVRELEKLRSTRPYLLACGVERLDAESLPSPAGFDTVICQGLLERASDDVAVLRAVREKLEEGGQAIVLVPQGPGLYGSLDRLLGLARRYTRNQLEAAARQAGLRPVAILAFNRLGSLGWWLNSRLLRRRKFGLAQIKILNLLVSVLRKLDGLLPLPPLVLIGVFQKDSGQHQGK